MARVDSDSDRGDGDTGGAPSGAPWARVKALFLAALDVPDEARGAFLDRVCADDAALRAEVASLLASDREADELWETPAARFVLEVGADPADAEVTPQGHLPPGTRLGAYEITGFLAAGGMGEVYRARHTLLGREVAIKTVRQESGDDAAGRRLLREARNAAVLEHPGICTIHEVGVSGNTPFIVMSLVHGRPLRDVVRAGVPPLRDTLSWGIQIASALEHAHGRGIVHRDLKSSNVMIEDDGRAVVLDFGLARRVSSEAAGDTSITVTGALAGTPSHMAPEMLLGQPTDHRIDVWALGVLLYELVSGELPFDGRTPFETTAAILNDPPRPLTGVPLALRLTIERCLVRDPAARTQTAAHVRQALDAIRRRRALPLVGRLLIRSHRGAMAAGAAAVVLLTAAGLVAPAALERLAALRGRVETLVVFPLEAETTDAGGPVYAAGMTEGLIARLGETANVRLIARASAAYAIEGRSPVEAARALGADAIITGRLRRSAERIGIDVRLTDASNGRVFWSDSFERTIGQVLALETDVARAIADAIRLGLRPGAGAQFATVRAVNPEAYEAYLKGRFEWNQRTPASLDRAVVHFNRAIELDPTYAPAWAALADCYNQFGTVMVGVGSPREYRPRAAEAAIRALRIDPQSAEAHAALAYVRHYDWQWAEAEQGFRRAIELNPSHALARIWYANYLMSRKRFDEALEQVHIARDLDPFSLVVNTNVGWIQLFAGRLDDALVQLERTLVIDSTYSQARMRLIDVLVVMGRFDEAHHHAHRLLDLNTGWPPAVFVLGIVHARSGNADSARIALASLLERSRTGHVSSKGVADLHSAIGDVEGALVWFARVIAERSNGSVYLAIEPDTTPARRDPRFHRLLAEAGLN